MHTLFDRREPQRRPSPCRELDSVPTTRCRLAVDHLQIRWVTVARSSTKGTPHERRKTACRRGCDRGAGRHDRHCRRRLRGYHRSVAGRCGLAGSYLPLDYDQPRGATTEVAVLRVKAKDQANKIGSLFVNPGGPSIPATKLALAAPSFMSDELLDRFDIVGVDPRGIGSSQNVRCFASGEDQASALDDLGVLFPIAKAEKQALNQEA
ncbi:hypothetical protein [Nonomuraea angiospora]